MKKKPARHIKIKRIHTPFSKRRWLRETLYAEYMQRELDIECLRALQSESECSPSLTLPAGKRFLKI